MADRKPDLGLSDILKPLWALVAAGLVGFVYWIASSLFPNTVPSLTASVIGFIAFGIIVLILGMMAAWPRVQRRLDDLTIPVAKGDRLSILVAELANDSDGTLTERIEHALAEQFEKRVEVLRPRKKLRRSDRGGLEQRTAEAEAAGYELLRKTRSDVLIWGSALRSERVIDLNFLAKDVGSTGATRSYALNQTMRLPEDFGDDLSMALAAVAVSAVAPATNAGKYFVPALVPVMERLNYLVENPPHSLRGESKAQVFHAFALACQTLGEQTGNATLLHKAILANREVLKEWPRERWPIQWAAIQTNLGSALTILGEHESGTAKLEEAVIAFREALKEATPERAPLIWAGTQNNLGDTLRILGERINSAERLKESITALYEAMRVFRRDLVPQQWAATQNNLGIVLLRLGIYEHDTTRLENAVIAFRGALKERTREREPLHWAANQNNLGETLRTLGELKNDPARLEYAIEAFHESLKEYTRERVPLDWAMVQTNLGIALLALGERENNTARLEEARDAFSGALGQYQKANMPYADVVHGHLASVEARLRDRPNK